MKDARYFPHDDNAQNDPKIRALIKKYGMKGYGMFWVIIETMRETRGYKITFKKYVLESFAEQMQCTIEEIKQFIEDCIEEFELFARDDGFFYSPSLLLRMTKLDTLRFNRQKAAYVMHEKYGHNITEEPIKE